MKTVERRKSHSDQLAKRAVLLLWNVIAARKLIPGFLLAVCVLVQTGCHADDVPERIKKLLEESKMNLLLELPKSKAPGVGMIFADNQHLCAAGDKIFKIFDVYAGKDNNEFNSFHIDIPVRDMWFLPPGRKELVVGWGTKLQYMQDIFNKSPRLKEPLAFPPYTFLTFSNGMAIFDDDFHTGFLLVDTINKQKRTISIPKEDLGSTIIAAAYSSKSKFFVAGGSDGVLWRWDLGDKHTKLRYRCPIGRPMPEADSPKGCTIFSLAVSPDGTNIAVSAYDKVIRLLTAADGTVINKFNIDSDSVDQHLLYSNDGRMLISIEPVGHNAQPSMIRFWDVKKGVEICSPYVGHKTRIISCCLSPNNSLLATGSYDGSILVWKVPSLTPKGKESGNP